MRSSSRLVVALALPLVLPACAEKDRVTPSQHATPFAVPSVPATVFPAPSSLAPTPDAPTGQPSSAAATTAAPGGGGAGGGGGNKVLATGVVFEPKTLKVKVGTKVTFESKPGEFHSVDSGTPATGAEPGPLKAPIGFTTYTYTFDKAGTFKYFCQPHASVGMVGEVVVA